MAEAPQNLFDNLIEAISQITFEIGHQYYAKPTHLVDPHDFFVLPYSFLPHLRMLNKAGEPLQPEELKVHSTVIYESHKPDVNKYLEAFVDKNIRGSIVKVDENHNCVIHALDHGFLEENVPIERIFHAAYKESTELPPLVHHCELFICAPIGQNFNDKAIDAFKYYIGNEKLSVVVRGIDAYKLKVVVYNSYPDDISTLLGLTQYTCLAYTVHEKLNLPERRHITYIFDHLEFAIGETIPVRVQSGVSLNSFYVTPEKCYKVYIQNRSEFTNYCKTVPVINEKEFRRGTSVGVYDDSNGCYERAMVLRVDDVRNTATVKLVDWGAELEVPKSKIKAIRTKLYMASPALAVFCRAVDGFQPWATGLPHLLFKGYTFNITFKEMGHGFRRPHVVLPSEVA